MTTANGILDAPALADLGAIVNATEKRLRILRALQQALLANMRQPRLMSSPPTIVAPASATAFTTPYVTYAPCDTGVPNLWADRYTFCGATWVQAGSTFPNYAGYGATSVHLGDGVDPSTNPGTLGCSVRWTTTSPDFEIVGYIGGPQNEMRLKVDGEYVSADATPFSAGGVFANRFTRITWGDGSATYRKLRTYELIYGASARFGGIRCHPNDIPDNWPDPSGLRVMMHGDSMCGTVSGLARPSNMRDLTMMRPEYHGSFKEASGIADVILSGVGGTGFVTGNGLSPPRSTFLQRATIDVVAMAPDVIAEIGGLNDPSNIQAAVLSWLTTVITAKPETIIFMTGPTNLKGTDNTLASYVARRDEKFAAAAAYPKNVYCIDNLGAKWVTGSGRDGSHQNDGNSDLIRGDDGTHWSPEGGQWGGYRLARAISEAIPAMIARQTA